VALKGAHFAADAAHALAYTTNPGFGGASVYRLDVSDSVRVLHVQTVRQLAEAYLEVQRLADGDDFDLRDYAPVPDYWDDDEWRGPWSPSESDAVFALTDRWSVRGIGAYVFEVLENARGVIEALEASDYDWVAFPDNYPERCTTWRCLGDGAGTLHHVAELVDDADLHSPEHDEVFEEAARLIAQLQRGPGPASTAMEEQ